MGELGDVRTAAIEPSLGLLENLHTRWVLLLRTLGPAEWSRQFRHPDWDRPLSLDDTLALYAWHGKHHVAHITELRRREGWKSIRRATRRINFPKREEILVPNERLKVAGEGRS